MSDGARPNCSEGDNARIGARMMGVADKSEKAESKIDIITPDKTNNTPLLISY